MCGPTCHRLEPDFSCHKVSEGGALVLQDLVSEHVLCCQGVGHTVWASSEQKYKWLQCRYADCSRSHPAAAAAYIWLKSALTRSQHWSGEAAKPQCCVTHTLAHVGGVLGAEPGAESLNRTRMSHRLEGCALQWRSPPCCWTVHARLLKLSLHRQRQRVGGGKYHLLCVRPATCDLI
jgi:hypothetical protein